MDILILICILLLSAPAVSELEVTGIIGESVLLSCDLNSSTAIDTSRLRFYWQDKSGKVLYSFNKGEENQHQARFPTPSVTVNKTNMNTTCSTQGGYPQPVVTWTIQDVLLAQNRTLDPWEVQTKRQPDPESGLYTVWSQVNIRENQTVTCHIFNPVLRETVSNTTIVNSNQSINTDPAGDVQEGFSLIIIVVITTVLILFCFGVGGRGYFVYKKRCRASGGTKEVEGKNHQGNGIVETELCTGVGRHQTF
ncbi:uncharacterized protein [Salvelinus alpinus]|uniref:uncharacterized protein isoform X2 n=1 Tax=Salvelinus alpinus TaxID=8036 RepID=UPI0039FC4F62